jgi:hypothetical protein
MARGKTAVRAPALSNALIRALVAELPLPARGGFPAESRESWIAMARHAFDVVYGVGALQACGTVERPLDPSPQSPVGTIRTVDGTAGRRFYVDHDGFAMVDGRPLAFDELPSIVTLGDERSGFELGDFSSILWKGIGTVTTGLPAGVRLVPAIRSSKVEAL